MKTLRFPINAFTFHELVMKFKTTNKIIIFVYIDRIILKTSKILSVVEI